jgi:periplasmic divalent cation tolerance protein
MVVVVLSTLPPADADRIAGVLVDERLAACVNLTPVRSVYRWQGAIQRDDEILAVVKTTAERAPALSARLRELHPYEVPEIVVLQVADGLPAYLAWVAAETTPLQK